ncbi:TonB-dependent receptor [Erythrobacter aquimaris]|uniref:TonB-dependent receptor n=1 Tax=Qipengyuania aquimaris TaxID=255984 RepID=A0A6I4TK67_9SPHN|nr:TonB-dependent receptor [Qipengyuania aquimaris]MXO96314.1 TonB-dependent receptor [Qipengyuania aquimaris]
MRKIHTKTIRGLAFSASALALTAGSQAYAQDAECPEGQEEVAGECVIQSDGVDGVANNDPNAQDVVDVTDTGATGQSTPGAIVVTGSRIKRDTYSSISPLQVITAESTRDAGLFDPSQILQRDEAATGQQIDATFQGFVLDNGPGQQTVDLRGLGANRTLLLLNGRRLAPAGVSGAPSAPSTNLLPSALVDRTDLLLDGASSVYGSDAVAGVVNVILRKDFDGLELFASGNLNEQGGGNDYNVSAAYGINFDRGFIGFGAEYNYRDEIRFKDRDFLAGCETHYELGSDGSIRTVGLLDQIDAELASDGTITQAPEACKRRGQGLGRSLITDFGRFGVIYYDPPGNTTVPGYTESTFFNGDPVDLDGDGIQDIRFADYSTNGAFPQGVFIPKEKRYNALAYGEYILPGEANITPFFEFLYSRSEVRSEDSRLTQAVAVVPDNNPFNPCNPNQPNGVSCFDESFVFNNGFSPGFNIGMPVLPRFSLIGDRDNFKSNLEQYRGVIGVRGDLPFISPSWSFEVTGVYTRSDGTTSARGLREDKYALSLGIDPTRDFNGDGIVDFNNDGIADDYDPSVRFAADPLVQSVFGYDAPVTPCAGPEELANPELAAPGLFDGCIAFNPFRDDIIGQFRATLTPEEEAYLFDDRSFRTVYEQKLFSAFATGDLFELPAGPVGAVIGVEWREDSIDSQPNFVAANGLQFNIISDLGAVGSKWIREAFAEIDLPLIANKPFVQELTVNVSGRITDEEFYGTAGTFSIKGGWRPISPLLLRFSYGTSFRAPNLRENFLRGQTGFLGVFDPCAVPTEAFVNGAYDASRDNRDPAIFANCEREGRDPTTVGIDNSDPDTPRVFQSNSVEISTSGSLDLDPETSRSITAGFAFEETFGDGWDVSLSTSYYDIKVKDSVIRPGLQFSVNDCYARQDGVRSQFCDQLFIDPAPTNFGLISDAALEFINLDADSVRGFDFNANFGKEVGLFGTLVDLGLDLRANHLVERSNSFVDPFGVETISRFEGEFFFPSWTGRATFTAEIDKWAFTWQTRWVGEQEQDVDGIDPFADAFGFGPDGEDTGFVGNTCTGFGSAGPDGTGPDTIPADGIFCRDIGYADDYFEHAASIRYRAENWSIRLGVTNLFDRDPPLVDGNEILSISNVPLGGGYNLDGREFFATVNYQF